MYTNIPIDAKTDIIQKMFINNKTDTKQITFNLTVKAIDKKTN